MSYSGRAETDASYPRAHAICDRCGFRFNHYKLRWQNDWRGPRMQNIRILVCPDCMDAPQQNGQRTILIPADPIPVMNARPEDYVGANNPLSGIGADPSPARWQFGSIIGNMTGNGGVQSAFDGNTNKPSWMSAIVRPTNSSFNNYVGVNWSGPSATIVPSSLNSPVITHTLASYTITSPNNASFGSSAYVVQGSQTGGVYAAWTTLSSGTLTGDAAQIVSGTCVGGRYQFHRVAFSEVGGGGGAIVAQVEFNVSDGSSNAQGV